MSSTDAPDEGSLLVTKFQEKLLCLQVERVINAKTENQEIVHLICKGVFIRRTSEQPNTTPSVKRLTFEIWVKKGETSLTKLNDLAFNTAHERFWGKLAR